VHRFDNGAIHAAGRMYWDLLALWNQVQTGLRAASLRYGDRIVSVGVDTWGVDFGLLGRGDELLGNPYHYRDSRTAGIFEKAFAIVPREDIFAATGLQFMEFNTLFQLLAMKLEDSPLLDNATSMLLIPDIFNWLLTGEKVVEQTNASTTQMYNPVTGGWADDLLARFELPTGLAAPVAEPGANLGKLRPEVAHVTGLPGMNVVLPGTHDTASAVMAVPARSEPSNQPDWCYISSGTWSLMGVETPDPVINDRCRELNFTNEGGVGGRTRLLKNIGGLWLVQECRRIWKEKGDEYGWQELVRRANESQPLVSLVNPDHPSFTAPDDMPAAIAEFCRQHNEPAPESVGAVIRSALESLAMRYRMVLGWLESLTGGNIATIHIVGGGTQNRLLCQMAADACNRRVVAGPVEATAIGNVMMQAVSAGDVASIGQAREIIASRFNVEEFTPQNPALWNDAYHRFEKLV